MNVPIVSKVRSVGMQTIHVVMFEWNEFGSKVIRLPGIAMFGEWRLDVAGAMRARLRDGGAELNQMFA
ncbi:hypothetical protein AB0C34_12695 [Nocardia sp. NPDC049220]|uniref:hypothetical protein n=1 Tax=Nocardia sp. NPDC049220 TaxID=3155273 RepID=UPI0033C6728A